MILPREPSRPLVPSPVASKFAVVHLQLGFHRFDVTHRAVVVGVVQPLDGSLDTLLGAAEAATQAGADILAVKVPPQEAAPTVEAVHQRFGLPISVDACGPQQARAALDAGAVMIWDRHGLAGADYFAAAATARAAVVTCPSRVAAAEAAGVARTSLVLDAGAVMGHGAKLVSLGHLVQVSSSELPTISACVSAGWRLVRTTEVARARRVRDVLGAVSEAR